MFHRHDPDVLAGQPFGLETLVKGIVAREAVGEFRRLAARRKVFHNGRDRLERFGQQAALAQALGELDAHIAIRILRDQPAEELVGLLVRTDVAKQFCPGEQAVRTFHRLGQMAFDQGQGLVDMPLLHETGRAIADDLEIVRAFFQERRPLLGQALVQARRLLQTQEKKADFRIGHMIARQRFRARQVFLCDLNPARLRDNLFQLGMDPLKIGRNVLLLGA
ncbi:hypothetical protein D9M68_631650 [compost metagenome]